MANITAEMLVNHLYNNKLPQIYRNLDLEQLPIKQPLYRYLQSLIIGGSSDLIKDIEGLLYLVDPETCPDVFLPLFLQSFGIEFNEDIDAVYQRKLVSNIGELVKRRGTYSCVKYLAKVLTGMDVNITREENEEEGVTVTVTLLAETLDQVTNLDISTKVLERYLTSYIPFWLLPIKVDSFIKTQNIQFKMNTVFSVSYYSKYDLVPPEVRKGGL